MNLGLGVLINYLGGNEESIKDFKRGVGKKITALSLSDDRLHFVFEDGYKMDMFDDGQSCCENRYMTTDDDLASFVGSILVGAELREAPTIEDEYGDPHEIQFLLINTSLGTFTCETHNEHNGYYGGFWVIARAINNANPAEQD
jgi:hypothetical protein